MIDDDTNEGDPTRPVGTDDGDAQAPRRRGGRRTSGTDTAGRTPRAGGAARRKGAAVAGAAAAGAEGEAEGPAGSYRTRDLVERVAKVAGMKRRSVKPLVETVLGELSAALHAGRPLSLRPLGKVTVSKTREAGGGQVLVCRIRQRGPRATAPEAAAAPDEALAEVAEGR
jgi:DNA-binding protein HU-alpha